MAPVYQYDRHGPPEKPTLKTAVWPTLTVWLVGCCVMV
jgi:hypothetical protein